MGFLGRSKSLRRKQSDLTSSRSSEERMPAQKRPDQRPANVHVTQEFEVSSARRDAFGEKNVIRPGTANRPSTAAGKQQRNNPLPTPDKEPSQKLEPQNTQAQIIEITSDSHIYRFPTPSPSTPRGSPSLPSQDATIGIALGSPRLQPPQYLSNSPKAVPPASPLRTFSEPIRTPATAVPVYGASMTAEPTKLRKQKSRSFKNIFSSKAPSKPAQEWQPPIPASHWERLNASRENTTFTSKQSVTSTLQSIDSSTSTAAMSNASTTNTSVSNASVASTNPRAHSRSDSNARAFARQQMRAEMDKAHLDKAKEIARQSKAAVNPFDSTPPATAKLSITPKPLNYTPIRIPQANQDALDRINQGWGGAAAKKGFLDVDIPKSEMERYSVMFEKLLKPRESIAERRGTLKRLRPLGEVGEEAMPSISPEALPRRRATSPSMPTQPSPGRSPQPSPRSKEIMEKSIQAVNKAHQEAANQLLKMRRARTEPIIPTQPTRAAPSRPIIVEPTNDSPESPQWSEASLPLTPDSSIAQTFFSVEDDDETEIITAHETAVKIAPQVDEAAWDTGRPGPQRMDSLELEEKIKPHPLRMNGHAQMGQVGVARTISLSRANKPKHTPITVKQPLKPRVVDVDTRKSTLVTIEQA